MGASAWHGRGAFACLWGWGEGLCGANRVGCSFARGYCPPGKMRGGAHFASWGESRRHLTKRGRGHWPFGSERSCLARAGLGCGVCGVLGVGEGLGVVALPVEQVAQLEMESHFFVLRQRFAVSYGCAKAIESGNDFFNSNFVTKHVAENLPV